MFNFGFHFGGGLNGGFPELIHYTFKKFGISPAASRYIVNEGKGGSAYDATMHSGNHIYLNGTDQYVDYPLIHQLGNEEYDHVEKTGHNTGLIVSASGAVFDGSDTNNISGIGIFYKNVFPDGTVLKLALNTTVNSGTPIINRLYNGGSPIDVYKSIDGTVELDIFCDGGRINTELYMSNDSAWDITFNSISVKEITLPSNSYMTYYDSDAKEFMQYDHTTIPVSSYYRMTNSHQLYMTHTAPLSQADLDALNGNSNLIMDVWFNGASLPSGFSKGDIVDFYAPVVGALGDATIRAILGDDVTITNYTAACRSTLANQDFGIQNLLLTQDAAGLPTGISSNRTLDYVNSPGSYVDTKFIPNLQEMTFVDVVEGEFEEWVKKDGEFYFESDGGSGEGYDYYFKCPSTESLWLNGVEYKGQDSTMVAINSNAKALHFKESTDGCLVSFGALDNKLTGNIPDLSSNTEFVAIDLGKNKLTGSIPDLSHNAELNFFSCYDNQLTGVIPDLSNNTKLEHFFANSNRLTGSIPDLSHNTALKGFYCFSNNLTGNIPDLSNNTSLEVFTCAYNNLTGNIPDLSNNTVLQKFNCMENKLTGFDGGTIKVTRYFRAYANQLTQKAVDDILVALVDGGTTGSVEVGLEANSEPSSRGKAAVDTLRDRGCTVAVDGY